MKKIYLDHNATTPVLSQILEKSDELLSTWGNPSSIHWASRQPKIVLRETRKKLSEILSAQPLEFIFTSGASESNTTAIMSVWSKVQSNKSERCEFITTEIEHPSVYNSFKWIQLHGGIVHFIKVNQEGELDWNHFHNVLNEKTALVSMMHVNNETGLILPILEVSRAAKKVGALVHSDLVQAFGKMPIDLKELQLDYASISAHKVYALKGTGVLFCRRGVPLTPLIHGGAQERNRRGGTENVVGISALNIVLDNWNSLMSAQSQIRCMRDLLETRIRSEIKGVSINHEKASRNSNTTSLIINDVAGETLLMSMDLKGFAVSTGAACSSGNPMPSKTLISLGLSHDEAQSSLRLSLGIYNSEQDIHQFCEELKSTVERLRFINQAVNSNQNIKSVYQESELQS